MYSVTILQDAGGQGVSEPYAINASGEIVGSSDTATGYIARAPSIKSQSTDDSPSPNFAASPGVSNANVSLATSDATTINPGGAPPGYYYDAATNSYVIDPPGTYSTGGATAPTTDPGGTYSAAGASAATTDPAGTYSSPYSLTRLFVDGRNTTPANAVLSFNSITAVENYFGVTSPEASLAKEFFAGYGSTSATMLFTRYARKRRPHLLGANISGLGLTGLQKISGTVAITFQGYTYSGSINLSGVGSFKAAAEAIKTALNSNLQVTAVTAGSSIAPATVSVTASANGVFLQVTSVAGVIYPGARISGPGVRAGDQIVTQLNGTPGGPGLYSLFQGTGTVSSETMTETYGVLTVGSATSGTVAVGQEVRGVGVSPKTAIEDNLSGSGPGSTWVLNNPQTVGSVSAGVTIKTTATPLSVILDWGNKPIIGATENNDFFDVSPNLNFPYDNIPSTLSYMSGTAAAALGLTQASGAIDSSPGGQNPTAAEFMNNLIQNENSKFGSFQTTIGSLAAGSKLSDNLAAWAQSSDGYQFLSKYTSTTPPAGSSLPTTDPAGTYSGPGASAPITDPPPVLNIHANDLTYASTASGYNHFIDLENFEASFPDLIKAFGTNSSAMQQWYNEYEPSEQRVETFDGLDYVASYDDLINAFSSAGSLKAVQDDGAQHYITNGLNEGRTTTFNGLDYIASYPDLIKAFGTDNDAGAYHYIENGSNEGRTTTFDGLDYIASYPDLINAYGPNEQGGAAHFIANGYNEGRTTTFDGLSYIANYVDLINAFGANNDAGAIHYITYGYNEHRTTAFSFDNQVGAAAVAAYESTFPSTAHFGSKDDAFFTAYIDTFKATGHYLGQT